MKNFQLFKAMEKKYAENKILEPRNKSCFPAGIAYTKMIFQRREWTWYLSKLRSLLEESGCYEEKKN